MYVYNILYLRCNSPKINRKRNRHILILPIHKTLLQGIFKRVLSTKRKRLCKRIALNIFGQKKIPTFSVGIEIQVSPTFSGGGFLYLLATIMFPWRLTFLKCFAILFSYSAALSFLCHEDFCVLRPLPLLSPSYTQKIARSDVIL